MKRLATVSTLTLILVSCSSAISYSDNHTIGDTPSKPTSNQALPGSSFITTLYEESRKLTMLEQQEADALEAKRLEAEKQKSLILNGIFMDEQIVELRQHVDKTWYVFSGSTPRGWDCSGLVRWYYAQLGIDIPHSASKQGQLKPKVKDPKPGDIVVFKYKNSKNHHHSGVYIGNNKAIHAGFKSGDRAEVISLDHPSFDNNQIHFVRLLERN